MNPILEVHKGCFAWPGHPPLLRDITLSLEKGKVLAVMGRNGIGKTTLIKCIVGILGWTGGSSSVNGIVSRKNKPVKEIGYVPQAHKVSFAYSVRDMVVFGKAGHGSYFAVPGRQDYSLADEILGRVGIYHLRDSRCNELSGGQLQMVLIARALINSPRLLVLDEPESHLDFCNQIRLLNLIRTIAQEDHMACMLNTHYPDHALRIADQCFLLGEKDYVTGATKEVMTDEMIQKYFGVYSHSVSFEYKGERITSFSFLEEVKADGVDE